MPDDSDRAAILSDQALAFLGFAFAAYTPQLALLTSLAFASSHSIALPFRAAGPLGPWPAFFAATVLLLLDDAIVVVFVFAALARYDTVFALGEWPMHDVPGRARGPDWSSRRAYVWSLWETWFFRRHYRAFWTGIIVFVFFGVTTGYLLWLVWASL